MAVKNDYYPTCMRTNCFANYDGTCNCLVESYDDAPRCPFFKPKKEAIVSEYQKENDAYKQALTDLQGKYIALFYEKGLSAEAISSIVNMPINTVAMIIDALDSQKISSRITKEEPNE